jgi:2-methylisocitrate lyase-like PEP mutase family enzyme
MAAGARSVHVMTTQATKAERFAALHREQRAFVIPNPWDAGTALLLERLGFEALATTSSGFAFSAGRQDGATSREEMLDHVATIARASSLPVSADLQHGYGDDPDTVAETILLAARAGAVGASIEDHPFRPGGPLLYPFDVAVERVRAAVATARSLPFPFTLTARSEGFLVGQPDLDETIRRLQAYEQAGADVLYAPGLPTKQEIAAVAAAVDRPVNVVAGLGGLAIPVAELEELGVRRISLGSTLARTALGAFVGAAEELRERGTFDFVASAIPYARIDALLAPVAA